MKKRIGLIIKHERGTVYLSEGSIIEEFETGKTVPDFYGSSWSAKAWLLEDYTTEPYVEKPVVSDDVIKAIVLAGKRVKSGRPWHQLMNDRMSDGGTHYHATRRILRSLALTPEQWALARQVWETP